MDFIPVESSPSNVVSVTPFDNPVILPPVILSNDTIYNFTKLNVEFKTPIEFNLINFNFNMSGEIRFNITNPQNGISIDAPVISNVSFSPTITTPVSNL